MYWHKFKDGTLKTVSPISWFTAKIEDVAKRQKTSGADASTLRAVELAARCGSLSSLPVRPLSFALSLSLDSFVKPLRRP